MKIDQMARNTNWKMVTINAKTFFSPSICVDFLPYAFFSAMSGKLFSIPNNVIWMTIQSYLCCFSSRFQFFCALRVVVVIVAFVIIRFFFVHHSGYYTFILSLQSHTDVFNHHDSMKMLLFCMWLSIGCKRGLYSDQQQTFHENDSIFSVCTLSC